MAFKIPGGRDKDKPINEVTDESLNWWLNKKRENLAADPDGKWAASDKDWIAAAEAELKRRAGGGKPAAPTQQQRQPAPTRAIQRQQPAGDIQALGAAMHDPAAVTAKLNELAAGYHIVGGITKVDGLPAGCGVAISFVTVDPDPSKDGPGEVYSVAGKLGLSGTTLAKIGAAAGVSWDPQQCGRLDNGAEPHYCHFRAVGSVRNFDGSVRILTGEVEIDARDGGAAEVEIRTKAADKPDKGDSQLLELRKFLLRHAERKAKNRAIADMGIKRAYTRSELGKAFAIPRLMFTGQSDDSELRKMFAGKTADAMLGGMNQLYGGRPPAQLPPPAAPVTEHAPQQFTGHAPPPLGARTTHDADGETAPDSEPYGRPTDEELRESGREDYRPRTGTDPEDY
jgi:hypothetical protein